MLHDGITRVLAGIRDSSPPAGMGTRVGAVDGLGGAGKSSLADRLALELDAPVVHTDDFASWDDPLDWWPAVLEHVLEPLAAGRAARYLPATWGGPPKPPVVIEPGPFLLLEGVGSSREAFRPYLAYAIWIETPRELRLRRGLERDGEDARDEWERWMAQEDAWVARERPADHADVVLPGDAGLWG